MISDIILALEARRQSVIARFEREDGVTAIEYGLIAALIAIVIIAALVFVGEELEAIFDRIGEALSTRS